MKFELGERCMFKLLIWGTGTIAKQFVANGYNGEIIGFIETNKTIDFFMDKPVYDSKEIPEEYDYIVVANTYCTQIYDLCKRNKMDESKMIFLYGVKQRIGCTKQEVLESILLEKNYTNYCAEFGLVEGSFYSSDKEEYGKLNTRFNFKIDSKYEWPVIKDKYAMAGTIGNYFWQDLWAARLIHETGVKRHYDIGSRIDGFIAHLLAMDLEVNLIDIREFPEEVENLYTTVDDATMLTHVEDESLDSLSALCSLEHFGLGRYGDPIDPEACFKSFCEIQKKLKVGGNLYISLPIGKERVEFNAHRVFYPETVIQYFDKLELVEFSCTANGKIEYNVDIHKYDNDKHNGNYRYGLFHFMRKE